MFASICEDKQTGDATICEETVKKNGEGQDKTVASLFWRNMDGFLIKDIFSLETWKKLGEIAIQISGSKTFTGSELDACLKVGL